MNGLLEEARRVLVATDLGEPADVALEKASDVARHSGGELYVCHVLPNLMRAQPLQPYVGGELAERLPALREAAGDAVIRRVSQITGRRPDELTLMLEDGSPHGAILEAADRVEADLIVVGTHGRTGLSHVLVGSVAERVVRHAHCSVLVARRSPPTGRVVAAIDFSDASIRALRGLAGSWARRLRGGLWVDYVLDLPPAPVAAPFPYLPAGLIPSGAELEKLRTDKQTEVEAAMREAGVEGKAVVLDGFPPLAICRHARELEAELIVVGTTGKTGLKRVALGSVAERVVREAPCSVVVARPSPAAPGSS